MGKKKRRKPKGKRQRKSQRNLREKILLAAAIVEMISNLIDFLRGR